MQETHASSAYTYPLLIRQLWHNSMACNADQEIVSGLHQRFSYRELRARVGLLAAGLTSLGVKQVYLINSYRVEKSFWGSPLLQPEKLQEQLLLGLEQACDTILPQVHLRQRFKPFVEDELPQIADGTSAFVAHPVALNACPIRSNGPSTLAIGPEGGFIPYEIEKLQECGFTPISLGRRILRVETAVPVLLSRFCAL